MYRDRTETAVICKGWEPTAGNPTVPSGSPRAWGPVMNKGLILILISVMFLVGAANAAVAPEHIDFVHYKNGTISPVTPDVGVQGDGFKLLGIRWKSLPVPFFVNPNAGDGLTDKNEVVHQVTEAFVAWDDATSKDLFMYNGTTEKTTFVRDHKNTVFWAGNLPSNVIARTRIWYNPAKHKILETDIKMNRHLVWGIYPDLTAGEFDIRNIVTHEAGHVCGLADLGERWSGQTMYGYSYAGDVGKVNLGAGDIRGLQRIYGA